MSGNKETEVHVHEYYGPLINRHIKTILESGLLLDEDYEVLLNLYNFKTLPERQFYKSSIRLLSSICVTFGAFIVVRKCHLPIILILPPAVITLGSLYLEGRTLMREKTQSEIINRVSESLIKVHKLNSKVIRYMKTRAELDTTKKSEYFSLYNKDIENFIKKLIKYNENFLQDLLSSLGYFNSLSQSLDDDYTNIIKLDIKDILAISSLNTIEECVKCTLKIQDIYIFFSSKLLNFLGVALAGNININVVENVMNKILPEILEKVNSYYDKAKSLFHNLRYSSNKKSEFKIVRSNNFNKQHITAKLQQTLMHSVNNLSIIMEKSQAVMSKLEELENDGDLERMESAIRDLKDHAFAIYESLEVLCKLYGILSNSKLNSNPTDPIRNIKCPNNESQLEKVHFDDQNEPIEESYELYIEKTDSSDVPSKDNYEPNNSSVYLSIMLQELKQSLKQHERFVAARNKRGSVDEDYADTTSARTRKEISPPKFDLQCCIELQTEMSNSAPPKDNHKNDFDTSTEKSECNQIASGPPPPPPPPSFSLKYFEDETGQYISRSTLDNIKFLSNQIKVEEDVFGDTCSDSD